MNLLAPPSTPGARRGVPIYTFLQGGLSRDAELRLLMEAASDAYAMARRLGREERGFIGYGLVEKRDGDGALAQLDVFVNKITTAGDQYYAQMGVALVSPASTAQPTKMSGMKLGTATTAVAKSSTGSALTTYITASNNPFDASFPSTAAVGSDLGWNATYKTSWAAGDVTNATINEVVIVNDAATDATSTSANTAARAVISTVNKTSSDSLAITWTHTFLGA
jgi:hypothetical protein